MNRKQFSRDLLDQYVRQDPSFRRSFKRVVGRSMPSTSGYTRLDIEELYAIFSHHQEIENRETLAALESNLPSVQNFVQNIPSDLLPESTPPKPIVNSPKIQRAIEIKAMNAERKERKKTRKQDKQIQIVLHDTHAYTKQWRSSRKKRSKIVFLYVLLDHRGDLKSAINYFDMSRQTFYSWIRNDDKFRRQYNRMAQKINGYRSQGADLKRRYSSRRAMIDAEIATDLRQAEKYNYSKDSQKPTRDI